MGSWCRRRRRRGRGSSGERDKGGDFLVSQGTCVWCIEGVFVVVGGMGHSVIFYSPLRFWERFRRTLRF